MKIFSKYLFVGAINFSVCTLTMLVLSMFGLHYAIYTAIGYILAFICSFYLNLHFTFQVSGLLKKRFGLFIGINSINLIIVELIQAGLIESLQTPTLLAIIIGMTWYTLTGFWMNQRWVFKQTRA